MSRTLPFENLPAVGRVTVSSPGILMSFEQLNEGKPYAAQIKPFNFLLSCHVRAFGFPVGADPTRFHLVAPYETNPHRWLKQKWIDQYSRNEFHISASDNYSSRQTARVKTYGDVIAEYQFHPESKCADSFGNPSDKQTIGFLSRRHVRIDQIRYIGKESNSLEEVEAGMVQDERSVYTEYPDPRRDEWQTKIVPILKPILLKQLMKESGLSRRALIYIRKGQKRPHREHRRILASMALDTIERQLKGAN